MMINILSNVIAWVLYFILDSIPSLGDEKAALIALATTIAFNIKGLSKRLLLPWFSLFFFALLSLAYLSPLRTEVDKFVLVIFNVAITAIMWLSVIIKQPFTLPYAKRQVPEFVWAMPGFIKVNMILSTAWALALTLITINSFLRITHHIPANISYFLLAALLIAAIVFTRRFPLWYRGYRFRQVSQHKVNIAENKYLQGNHAPVVDELCLENLEVIGQLPQNLTGAYMRNGPNPLFHPITYTYPLDGDGMIHAVYLQNGKAHYKNRFVETKGLQAEKRAGQALYTGIAKLMFPDPKLIGKDGDPGPVKDGAFIHIIPIAKQFLAMWEGGPAYEITAQLETIGEWTPTGQKAPLSINAHTRLDPISGELFGITYDLQPPYLKLYVFSKDGQLTKELVIEKSTATMMHDFVITQKYVVLFDVPAVFDLTAPAKGNSILSWQPERGVNIGIINRTSWEITWLKTEAFFVYHFANAYEEGNQIIVDYVRHSQLFIDTPEHNKTSSQLYRTTIDLNTNTIKHHCLNETNIEFPRINEQYDSLPYRYIYAAVRATTKDNQPFPQLIKYDLQKSTAEIQSFDTSCGVGEPIFIAKADAHNEDDGYIGTFVFDADTQSSEFILLHASDFTAPPLARMKLPQRVPYGLHGNWMPDVMLKP